MARSIKQTIESLAQMKPKWVERAKEYLLQNDFVEINEINNNTMFIFPDGSILGAPGGIVEEDEHLVGNPRRRVYHDRIYDILEKTDEEDDLEVAMHPIDNDHVARYYNLIILAAYHSTKWLVVPRGVDPTAAQWNKIYLFYTRGYMIDCKEHSTHMEWEARCKQYKGSTEALKYKSADDFNKARRQFVLPRLDLEALQYIEQQTLKNITKGRYADQVEMVSVAVLNEYAEFDRIDRSMLSASGIYELADDIIENGFKEYLFIEFNPHNGYVKLGEGNHRLAIANMMGIKDVPVLAIRSQYIEPKQYGPGKLVDPTKIKIRQQDETGTYYSSTLKPSEVAPELTHS